MSSARIELVMSEFGAARLNAGGARLDHVDRLNPTLDSFRAVFPDATVTLFTDQESHFGPSVTTVKVKPPFDRDGARYGWRSHDYYQAKGLLLSKADVAIAMDSDMLIVSQDFRVITEISRVFGAALPINPRLLLKIDGGIGVDSTYDAAADATKGLGLTYNLTPMAFATAHPVARRWLERYCERMEQAPGRGAVHLVNASYELGYQPGVLPPQWCVCSPRDLDSRHLWHEAIALHVGHLDVLPRWRSEMRKLRLRHLLTKVAGRT